MAVAAPSPASAGTGSPEDPWINMNIRWERPSAIGAAPITAMWSDIQSLVVAPKSFWSMNPKFNTTPTFINGQGYYIGFQTNTTRWGGQATLGPFAKGAVFSLFGTPMVWGYDTYKLLDPTHCGIGADGPYGVTCTIPYGWIDGAAYRLSVEMVVSTSSSLCPPLTPTSCRVYTGYIAPTSNVFARTLIGQWSLSPGVYGDVTTTNQFLEPFGGCPTGSNTRAEGRFVLPYSAFSGTYSAAGFLNLGGGDAPLPGPCARAWIDGFGSVRIKIQ